LANTSQLEIREKSVQIPSNDLLNGLKLGTLDFLEKISISVDVMVAGNVKLGSTIRLLVFMDYSGFSGKKF